MFTTARISKTNPWNWCHVGFSNVLLNCSCSDGRVSPLLLTVWMCIICRLFTFVTTNTLKYLYTSDIAPFPRPNAKLCQMWVYGSTFTIKSTNTQHHTHVWPDARIGIGASLAFCLWNNLKLVLNLQYVYFYSKKKNTKNLKTIMVFISLWFLYVK